MDSSYYVYDNIDFILKTQNKRCEIQFFFGWIVDHHAR